jgi:ADP-ribose pyrophosphatase
MTLVFESRLFSVEVGTWRYPNGRSHDVAIVRHRPSVVLIPVEADGRVVLIRQFRAPIGIETWEFPAGGQEDGETAEVAARRECEEEIGRVPGQLERLGAWYPVPGYCDEQLIFFRVWNLERAPADSPRKADEDEDILPRSVTVEQARAMVRDGEIVDLKTAFALTLL